MHHEASKAAPQEYPVQREFTVRASKDLISGAVDTVLAFLAENGSGDGKEGEIALALQEALANAVIHGCREDPKKNVHVRIGCGGAAGVMISVRDEGPGFKPENVADPLSEDGLARDRGRGIYLIRGLMDEVRYQHNGSEIVMLKK